jgi:tryptophan halogenase
MKIVIVGGGTAGWFTASYLKKNTTDLDITLIEDPVVPKTLVGESLAPSVTDFILELGVDEKDFMKSTNATYKLGIKFSNFSNLDKDDEFVGVNINFNADKFLSQDPITMRDFMTDSFDTRASDVLLELVKQGKVSDFIKYWNPHYLYMKKNVGFNSLFDNEKFKLDKKFGKSFHINAETTADYIRDKVALPAGVNYIRQAVNNVVIEDTTIKSLELDNGTIVEADLFVDCTGVARFLINKLDWKIKPLSNNKIDRAVVCQLAYEDKDTELVNYTASVAGPHGWMFRIPLYHRMGCGYCFSSAHVSEEEALAYYMTKTKNHIGTPRVIRWQPSRLEKMADGNVIAIGLSASLIEPLESNALRITMSAIKHLKDVIDNYKKTSILNFTKLNTSVCNTIDNFALYILSFYTLSQRTDTTFWQDMHTLGKEEHHEQLAYDCYMDYKNSVKNIVLTNSLVTLDQHWIQTYLLQDKNRSLNQWATHDISQTILNAGQQYFETKYNYLDQLSSNEISYNTWLTDTIFES